MAVHHCLVAFTLSDRPPDIVERSSDVRDCTAVMENGRPGFVRQGLDVLEDGLDAGGVISRRGGHA